MATNIYREKRVGNFAVYATRTLLTAPLQLVPNDDVGQYSGCGRHDVEDRRDGVVAGVVHLASCASLLSGIGSYPEKGHVTH